ncbi:MAG: ATP-binding protein [Pseudomonadota bacterium]
MTDSRKQLQQPGHLPEDAFAEADFALSHRRNFSIRAKIVINFLLCFVAIGAMTLISWLTISRIEQKLYFLDVAERYTSHIQQARRYEKNYFLYGTDLPVALEHLRAARDTITGESSEIAQVIGRSSYRAMLGHLDRYEQLLAKLRQMDERSRTKTATAEGVSTETSAIAKTSVGSEASTEVVARSEVDAGPVGDTSGRARTVEESGPGAVPGSGAGTGISSGTDGGIGPTAVIAGDRPERHRMAIETELREHGSEMVSVALRVVEVERQSVTRMLRLAKQIPLGFLVGFLVLLIYIAGFMSRQILGPLGRMVATTRRIAAGDFTPVRPARRYRDEFTDLAIAINCMVHELDRRQEMLAESHKLRAIGTLTAGIAHELNNPINNISLTVEALVEDHQCQTSEERLELYRDLLIQAERAQAVVRNLLDFTRQREPRIEQVDLVSLIQETTKLASNQMKLAKVALEVHRDEGLPAISGDRQQLSQVFLNLFLNAIDAMPHGGILRIELGPAPERDGFVRVETSDTGTGICDENLPYIFDPFFTTKGAKGTGLGLAVSYGIVTQHGGDIEVESRPGEGTTFTVLLPIARSRETV